MALLGHLCKWRFQKYLLLLSLMTVLSYESGTMKSLGVLLPTLCEQFQTQTWVIGLAISIIPGIGSLTCLVLPFLKKSGILNTGSTILCVGYLSCTGIILGSFCGNAQLFTMTLFMQSFLSLAKISALSLLPVYFKEDIDLVNSIASGGMSVGLVVMPPLTQLTLDIYGYKNSLLILGAITFNCVPCGLFIQHFEKKTQPPDHKLEIRDVTEPGCTLFNFELLRNVTFINILILSAACGWTYASWVIYLVPHAEEKGIQPSMAALLATSGGVANISGKFFFVVSKKLCSPKTTIYIACAVCCVALGIDPLFKHLSSLIFCSSAFAFAVGLAGVASFAIIFSEIGEEFMVDALTWFYVVYGTASLMGAFTTGWLYDCTHSYDASFIVLGATMVLPIITFGMEDILYHNRFKWYHH